MYLKGTCLQQLYANMVGGLFLMRKSPPPPFSMGLSLLPPAWVWEVQTCKKRKGNKIHGKHDGRPRNPTSFAALVRFVCTYSVRLK
jgi:hypothetical protein